MVRLLGAIWGECILIWGVPKKTPHKGLEVFAALPAPLFLEDKAFSMSCQKFCGSFCEVNAGITSAA